MTETIAKTTAKTAAARFYTHPGHRARIEEHIAKLNRRLAAAKSQTEPLSAVITTEVVPAADSDPVMTEVLVIELSWTISAAGWTLAGIITPTADGEHYTYRGLTLGVEEVTAEDLMMCEHCRTRRNRNHLFVITDEAGHRMQVGSTCLRPHTGLSATSGVMELLCADTETLLAEMATPAEDSTATQWAATHRGPALWPTKYLLGLGLHTLPAWQDRPQRLTAVGLPEFVDTEAERPMDAEAVTCAHHDDIAAITAHAQVKAAENDYWANVAAALASETTGARHFRLVISAVSSWDRDRAKAAEREREAVTIAQQPWAPAGTKLKTQPVEVTLHRVATFETFFSYSGELQHIYTFLTDGGHMLVWKTQKTLTDADGEPVWEPGARLRLCGGTVKTAEQYRGDVQTPLTRVRFEIITGAQQD